MELTEKNKEWIKNNHIQDVDKFFKEAKITLRLDADVPNSELRKMDINDVIYYITKYYEQEQIGGSNQ